MRALLFSMLLAECIACSQATPSSGPTEADSVSFTPASPAGGPSVYLRGRAEGAQVIVEVMGRDLRDVHGVAFRVLYDPEALSFVDATSSSKWSRKSVALAKAGTGGQLAVTWSEMGAVTGVDALSETTLGTLRFDVHGAHSSAIAFREDRSTVLDTRGTAIAVTWRGGSVAGR